MTDDALMVGQDLTSIDALRSLMEWGGRLPEGAVLFLTTPECFSRKRCDAFWCRLQELDGRYSDSPFPQPLTTLAGMREENVFYWLFKWIGALTRPAIATFRGEVELPFLGAGLACQYRIAASDAVFHNRCNELGFPPPFGLLYMLPAFVGTAQAASIMMRCRAITAEEALNWRLVDEIVPDGQIELRAKATAAEAGKWCPPNMVAAVKRLVSQHMPPLDGFFAAETLEVERGMAKRPWAKGHGAGDAPTWNNGQ